MAFKILKQSKRSWARVGVLETPHGEIETPAFVPVATQAALKGLLPRQAKDARTQILMVNTYHLWAREMVGVVENFSGLHSFMGWQGPLMTDSGGFQVFSLGSGFGKGVSKLMRNGEFSPRALPSKGLVQIDKEGIVFRSHIDGKKLWLTPEISIGTQEKLGADIIFALDECTSPLDLYEYNREALLRTHAWAKKSLAAKKRKDQLLFGIVQGGRFNDLRKESAQYIASLDFDGFGIGGGFGKEDIATVLEWVIPLVNPTKPRHFLGIGEVEDIKESVKRGVDLFDCVIPTRLARHAVLITKTKKIIITNAAYRNDKNPIGKGCLCPTCQGFSRAYLCHLFRTGEFLGAQLASIHNIHFYNRLMEEIREGIREGKI